MEKVDEIKVHIATSLDDDEIKELATSGMVMDVEEVGQFRVPADDTFRSGIFSGIWMIRADFAKNAEMLHDFIYGE